MLPALKEGVVPLTKVTLISPIRGISVPVLIPVPPDCEVPPSSCHVQLNVAVPTSPPLFIVIVYVRGTVPEKTPACPPTTPESTVPVDVFVSAAVTYPPGPESHL